MDQPKSQSQPDHRDDQISETGSDMRIKKRLNISSDKAAGKSAEANDVVREIDGDRVHTNPDKWLTPCLVLPDLDYLVKGTHQKQTITPGYQYVRRCPNLLYDWKMQAPEKASQHARHAGSHKENDFPLLRDELII